ncbi:glucosylglycerol ABC transporter membrane protein [Micromonospora pallida]|uniref:Glucosylglycerol ABC transporter membrane protein n=1 Tax=Micromonospora pallida TaxID=145854 RepID=A0A1C6SHK8_9ACTN|nr:sugar ABC transporter permease [Micromonospora pallida]SCL28990.1 glucosylglycerol ABC transporter membrane protein [Micromonospora pallida]
MDSRLITAVQVVVGVPAVLIAYVWLADRLLDATSDRWQRRVRPWLWLAPALGFLGFFLVYPTIRTIVRSLYGKNELDQEFVGLDNYRWFFTSSDALGSLLNNILWLVFFTAFTVGIGLLVAVLVDRVRYEALAKSIIFLPLAISMVAAGVIWKFMYDYKPPGAAQTGTLNALVGTLGLGPFGWLQSPGFRLSTFALIAVMVWMWTGFAMVIISAALKGIDAELLEAARVDGANEWQVFRRVTLPLLGPTLAVVATTMIITSLKTFDIVYTLTSGNYDTEVVANLMIKQMFTVGDFGRASAVAVVLLLAIVPIMAFNIRKFRAQESIR